MCRISSRRGSGGAGFGGSTLRSPLSLLMLALIGLSTIACSSSGTLQAMGNQPRFDPYEATNAFGDGMSARPVLSDTLTFMQPMTDTLLYQGTINGKAAEAFPFPVTSGVLTRGEERYNAFCAPCHGAVGDGKGLVAQRGFCCPASFHSDRLRSAPVGQFFDVITNGFGPMPSYGYQIPARDRWAIIAYIRALQLSQDAKPSDIPPDQQNQLGAPK